MQLNRVLKALADESRMNIIKTLLAKNCCVRSLARNLGISESAVSQHLKVLREAELVTGEKKGHHMHYSVNRELLRDLSCKINTLADIKTEKCAHGDEGCNKKGCHHDRENCSHHKQESENKNEKE